MFKKKIDIVFLWVDGTDKSFQKKRLLWQEKLNISVSRENNDTRYVDNEELRYSLRSIKKYASWINKIFIVTDNQVPKWLKKHRKIVIVNHKDFIPEKYLPTFNSDVIESFIADIPGLSEHFLYANDDMLINNYVKPDFFFDEDGKPIVRLIEKDVIHRKVNNTAYNRAILHSINVINKKYGIIYNFKPHHNIDSYTKTSFKECIETFKEEYNKLREQKFRGYSIQRIMFSLYMLANNQGILEIITPINKRKHTNSLCKNIMPMEKMQDRLLKNTPELICFNDENTVDEQNRLSLPYLFELLYPKKERWEKYPNSKINAELLAEYKKMWIKNLIKYEQHIVYNIWGIKIKVKVTERNIND